MLDDLKLWVRLLATAARGRMQYRVDLFFQILAMALTTAADFLMVWVLISACGPTIGWTLAEASLLYGVVLVPFGIVQFINAGFERFHDLVRRGQVDLLLLRPRPLLVLVAGEDLPVRQIGRLAQAVAVFAWALWMIPLSMGDCLLLGWAMAWGVVLYLSFDVIRAASAFWTVEGSEMWNVLTYGGSMAAIWPAEAYRPVLRTVLLTIVPVAAVGWLPVAQVLGKDHGFPAWVPWLAPTSGLVLSGLGLWLWTIGLRRYASSGS
ncbi:ABC transporter permease [Planctomycetota bacterium]|nr:ABC transporter permease [Planctomycetota bacterium]